jgi:hypothetical protein
MEKEKRKEEREELVCGKDEVSQWWMALKE